ncbi:MAG: ABC transporter substrate-binding protein [Gemmiger sp.]|uniref:ABC transporter substrate-binding protein n=1 Tax=Gemmiger sp. TaxID=2049027 RepID=UPI002E75E545|nr:ABC transporter substrate-binding protein [Gemmiger sp.]MEE0799874.1 ABC transporter substrate-binding protein [Gemmiger sp.]
MKRLFILAAALLMLAGCGTGTAAGSTGSVTIVDDLGRTVTLDPPTRVAALIGSFADIWCLAGGSDTLTAAANDAWTSFDGLPLDGVVNLGATKEVSLETLIASEPDLVLASCNTEADLDLKPTLEQMGIPVAYFQVSTFEEYLSMLDRCTQLTGDRDAYEENGEKVRDQVEAAKARADGSRPSVLYIRVSGSGCKVKNSQNNVLGEMLAALDCRNIADSNTGLLEDLSFEVILQEDPDYLFLVYQSADPSVAAEVADRMLRDNPAWNSLRAVQEGHCYVLDQKLYNLKPNARWGQAYEELADILYPAS